MVTVRDVWRGGLPSGTELLAGGSGLERRVEWAMALRTRPPAFDAIKGGELAFIPVGLIRLLDERLDLSAVMASLADKGGVAVAVLGEASSASLILAEQRMLPLLQLPSSVHLPDVERVAVRFILDQRSLAHERQQVLHSELTELALAGAGTDAIVERLATLTGQLALWQAADGAIRHSQPTDVGRLAAQLEEQAPAMVRWAESVAASAADPPVQEFDLGDGQRRVVAPIPGRGGIGGFVSVIGPDVEVGQLSRVAVARAAAACAIDLDRERAVLQAREDLEGGLVESLLTGTFPSEQWVRDRAARLGVDLGGQLLVMTVAGGLGAAPERLLRGAQAWIARRCSGAMATMRRGVVVVLVAAAVEWDGDELHRLGGELRAECAASAGGMVSVGIGRPRPGMGAVRIGFREAEQALAMGARLSSHRHVVSFGDLGLHRLLLTLMGQPELEEYYTEQVGSLVRYDQRSRAGLMHTLDAFFACHGSPTEMAQRLHLHRNTVLYRLRRIEEVGGFSLSDPDTRLNLHLCLRVRDVLALPQ